MPRDLIRDPEHDRTRSLGWLWLAWCEHWVVHGPGDIQGTPLDPATGVALDDELAGHAVDCYALAPSGRRLYDTAYLSRPKGRDKSGQAGRNVLFEALGPARFCGWARGGEVFEQLDFRYVYAPGEPMGKPVTYPYIRCLATEEGQTGHTYDNVYYNLTEGPLAAFTEPRVATLLGWSHPVDPGLTRTILGDGGEIVPSTSGNASKDGGKETFTVFDELHLYVTPELRRMYNTVDRNCRKRRAANPWVYGTSTMYADGEESVAQDVHNFARAIREGKTKARRLLFDHREAPPNIDLSDEAQLRAALIEVYGPFAEVMDLDGIINSIFDPRKSPVDSRRFWLNQSEAAVDAWLAEYEWAARFAETLDEPPPPIADRDVITLGFDGSRKRSRGITDATALIGCRVSDGHVFELGVWEQPQGPAGEGWQVPVAEVLAAVAHAFDRYTVVGFYADPAKWESHVAGWEAKYGSRLKVKASRQHPIEWWITGGRALQIVRATEQAHNAIVDGEMSHDGSYVLTRHVLQARRRLSRSGVQIAKEHPDSPRKIDAAIAMILAWQARVDAIAAGVGRRRTTGVPTRIR